MSEIAYLVLESYSFEPNVFHVCLAGLSCHALGGGLDRVAVLGVSRRRPVATSLGLCPHVCELGQVQSKSFS